MTGISVSSTHWICQKKFRSNVIVKHNRKQPLKEYHDNDGNFLEIICKEGGRERKKTRPFIGYQVHTHRSNINLSNGVWIMMITFSNLGREIAFLVLFQNEGKQTHAIPGINPFPLLYQPHPSHIHEDNHNWLWTLSYFENEHEVTAWAGLKHMICFSSPENMHAAIKDAWKCWRSLQRCTEMSGPFWKWDRDKLTFSCKTLTGKLYVHLSEIYFNL